MVVRSYTAVIPAYNAELFIADALKSIVAQSVPPDRTIVVDDGSTDGTAEVVRAFGGAVEYVRQDNTGPGGATTRGFSMVTTPWIATLDADDLWLPNKIETQFDALDSEPDTVGIFGRMRDFEGDPSTSTLGEAYDAWLRSTMLVRTAEAIAVGPMVDDASRLGDVIDWIARLRGAGHRLTLLPEVLSLRRRHPGNLSNRDREDLAKGYLAAARAALLRRRSGEQK
jgi:glycosyltransferase involved in cell wall biosynthesis